MINTREMVVGTIENSLRATYDKLSEDQIKDVIRAKLDVIKGAVSTRVRFGKKETHNPLFELSGPLKSVIIRDERYRMVGVADRDSLQTAAFQVMYEYG